MAISALTLPIQPLDPAGVLVAHHRRQRVAAVEHC
jgi:hypothetical protein